MPVFNNYIDGRNTFIWEPHQLDSTPDYSKATVYHFLHLNLSATGRTLESVKRPLENRLWYAYPGTAGFFDGNDNPTHVGRVLGDGTTQLTKYQYNSLGNVSQMIDPSGRVFNYAYAANGIDLTSVGTSGQTLFTAGYDAAHNITSLTDASGSTTAFTYNARGQVTSVTNPLNETTVYSYTPGGNLESIQAPLGKTTTFTYDSQERVRSVTDSEGYTAQVSHDVADRPTVLTYPDGTTDALAYDRLDVASTKDRLNRRTHISHDALRRVTSILDANGGTTGLTYGLGMNPETLVDPKGNTTTFLYDLQQRLSVKSYPDGAAQTVTYQSCCGRLRSVTDALGNTKTYSYFLDNQLKKIDYSGTTPDVTFTNDTFLPRPLTMTDGQGTTSMTYVPVGSPGANRLATIDGPFGDSASFNYDAASRPVGQVVNGEAESVLYDALWRPTQVNNALDTFNMTYLGATGQITGVTSGLGPQMQYAYANNVGDRRLLQIKNLSNAGTALSQFDYSYDAVGQITRLVSTTGSAQGDGEDDDDHDRQECRKKHCKKKHCEKHHSHHDDKDCNKKEKGHGKGHDKKKGKNRSIGKGKGHSIGKGRGHDHDYKREAELRRKAVIRQFNNVLANVWSIRCDDDNDGGAAPATTETWDFSYDNLSQLVGVNLNQNAYASYTFDSAGNLTGLTLNGITTNFTYNNLNQPNSPGSPAFDDKGQTTTDSEGRIFEWDEQGRVTAIVMGTQRSEFEYDGLSRRTVITELDNGAVVSKKLYWWLGGAIVSERDGLQTDFPITKRYFGQGVLQTTGTTSTRLFYTTDHLGSVRELTDENGTTVAQYSYTVYGQRTKVAGDLDSDFGYAGLFHHSPSGLDLATYRLYDAKQRRFISRDPLGEGVDYNLYRYAGNNPVNYLDPEGLQSVSCEERLKSCLYWANRSYTTSQNQIAANKRSLKSQGLGITNSSEYRAQLGLSVKIEIQYQKKKQGCQSQYKDCVKNRKQSQKCP